MSWQATIQDVFPPRDDRGWMVSLVPFDQAGGRKLEARTFFSATQPDNATVESWGRSLVGSLSAADQTTAGKLTYKAGDVVNTAALVVPTPTPTAADVAQGAWLADWALYKSLKSLADAGVIDPADKRLTDVLARLKANWQDRFLGSF